MNKSYWITVLVKSLDDLISVHGGAWTGRSQDEVLKVFFEQAEGLMIDLMNGGRVIHKSACMIDDYVCPSNSDNDCRLENNWLSLDLRKVTDPQLPLLASFLRDSCYAEPFIQKIIKSRTEAITEWNAAQGENNV